MIPIRSTIKTQTVPYVNYALIVVNILIFAYSLSLENNELEKFYLTYGVIPGDIMDFDAYGFIERTTRFFSSMAIHENWAHMVSNMIFLYIFGGGVENLFGHFRYLLFYVVCGLVAILIQTVFTLHSEIPVVGASGAISGVLGAYILFFPRSEILTLLVIIVFAQFVRIKAYIFVICWFAFQFLRGIGYIGEMGMEGVYGHLAGFTCGIITVIAYRRTKLYRHMKYKMERL